ncbi:MAG TPA: SDR family oxidoreductase, partial [Polyangiaceae bacterium LLY-WYZ-15_(1-7)]|nr:SDR family oxidoreductase [Polyangiaceae bacterium LLY-WYZ-15_(1-7)]
MKTNGHGKSGHGTGPNGHGPNGTNGSNGHARPRTGTRLRPGLELTGREGSVREGSGREGSVREAFAGKHLVVTGVTGFLGKVWLGMVLDFLPEVGRLTVIARGKKGEDAAARFQRIVERSPAFRPLREKHGPALRDLVAEK